MPLNFNEEAAIDGRTMNVFDYETFNEYRDMLKYDANIAVKFNRGDRDAILPVRGNVHGNLEQPGVYIGEQVDIISYPQTAEEIAEYYPDESRRFDFSNPKSMQDLLDKSERLNEIKNQILETPDNLTQAPLKQDDKPAMRGLKMAINAKGIDIDKYKDRFGENFPNNKRKLTDTDITLFQLYRYCECLDLDMDIIFRDAEGSIANPMKKVITVNVFPGNGDYAKVQNVDKNYLDQDSSDDDEDNDDEE